MAAEVPATKDKTQTLMQVLSARKDMFREVLPKYLTPERLFRVAQIAMSKNSALLNCTAASFVIAMMDAAKSGLEPNGKDGALVPYGTECQFQPMYQGLIKQAVRGGAAKKIAARVVHKNDKFRIWYDPEPHLLHEPIIDDEEGEIIGAYAYAILPDDTPHIEYMSREQLDHIRAKAKAKSFSPWQTDEQEMYRKTPVKRLFKYLPVPEEVEYAVVVDNQHETGANRGDMPVIDVTPTPQITQTERLKEKLKDRKPRSEKGQSRKAQESSLDTAGGDGKENGQGEDKDPSTVIQGISTRTLKAIKDAQEATGLDLSQSYAVWNISPNIPLEELDEESGEKILEWYKSQ